MKKFLFFVAAAFVCSTVGAQLVTSTSFKKTKSKTVWYLKAGANIANFSVSDGDGPDAIFGYNVGIAFDRPIGSSGVFWNSGLQLATKGWKYSYDDDGEKIETKLNANKLELPLTFGYKYSVNDDIAVDARLGGFVNYDVFGKYKESYDGEEESVNLGDLEDYDRLGAGIQFGIGVWYQKLNLNITFQKGLIEQMEGCKEKNWMISLGYAF